MAWKGDSWADLVARAAKQKPRTRRDHAEDRDALAARAHTESFPPPARIEVLEEGVRIGRDMSSVELALAQIYHLELVDPWPAIAIGWVDRGESYRAVLAPAEPAEDVDAFAARVE